MRELKHLACNILITRRAKRHPISGIGGEDHLYPVRDALSVREQSDSTPHQPEMVSETLSIIRFHDSPRCLMTSLNQYPLSLMVRSNVLKST